MWLRTFIRLPMFLLKTFMHPSLDDDSLPSSSHACLIMTCCLRRTNELIKRTFSQHFNNLLFFNEFPILPCRLLY